MNASARKQLFGTDGIRGVAGKHPLDHETLWSMGTALAVMLRQTSPSPRILLARDTRESGAGIAATLALSLEVAGARAEVAGVLPTPVLAFLTLDGKYDIGIMVSASHNPYHDNGVKVISGDGFKLSDEQEIELERLMSEHATEAGSAATPEPVEDPGLHEKRYLDRFRDGLGGDTTLSGLSVVLDCAQGAAYRLAPQVFEALGAKVQTIHCQPDGRNINLDCGSLHPEKLSRKVRESGADLGIAFDGDADRALAVDDTGRLLDGDFLLWRAALDLKARNRLAKSMVVATVMSNLWLEQVLRREGINLLRAPVGDKYVLEEMLRTGASLGGEQSGHIIYLDQSTTGDGILTGVRLADAVRRAGVPLSRWAEQYEPCPQVLINVKVRHQPVLGDHPIIGKAIKRAETNLGDQGRLLVRYSGTEPLVRVMVEGSEEKLVKSVAQDLAELIEREIGVESDNA